MHCESAHEFHIQNGVLWDGEFTNQHQGGTKKRRVELTLETCLNCFTIRFVNTKLQNEAFVKTLGADMLKDYSLEELGEKLILLKNDRSLLGNIRKDIPKHMEKFENGFQDNCLIHTDMVGISDEVAASLGLSKELGPFSIEIQEFVNSILCEDIDEENHTKNWVRMRVNIGSEIEAIELLLSETS